MNAWTRHVGPWALVGLACLVVFMQVFSRGLSGRTLLQAPEEERAVEIGELPGIGPLTTRSKIAVARHIRFGDDDVVESDDSEDPPASGASGDGSAGSGGGDAGAEDTPTKPRSTETIEELSRLAVSRVERVRLGIVIGELQGAQRAAAFFHDLAAEANQGGDVAADAAALEAYYQAQAKIDAQPEEDRAKSVRPAMDELQRRGLESRHGWFATVAETYGKGDSDPQRHWLGQHGRGLFAVFGLRVFVEIVFFLLGLVFLGITIKKQRDEGFEPEFYTTSVPGEVYLETVLVFFLCFALYLGVRVLLLGQSESWAIILSEVLVWSLVLSFLWPILRGVTLGELALDLGLERGQGVGEEILIGVAGFLVAAPLEMLVLIVGLLLEAAIFGEDKGQPGGVAMFRQPMTESWWPWTFGALGAVVWAPFIEECIFRGALHRWMPAKMGPVLRVLVSATLFGAVHPYSLAGLMSVGTSGLVFGSLREWRGSLIAPMTAHFLKNASIVGFELIILRMLE